MDNLFSNSKKCTYTDEELVSMVKNDQKRAFDLLTARYLPIIYNKAKGYHAAGLDENDFVQEGVWVLFLAVQGFDPDKSTSFKTYAIHCIDNRFSSLSKSSGRKKHFPLNSSVTLDDMTGNSDITPLDIEQNVINTETFKKLREGVSVGLTNLELSVLNLHLFGLKYSDIAENLGISVKSVDNALQRVRKKASLLKS